MRRLLGSSRPAQRDVPRLVLYIHKRTGSWNSLTAYARAGGERGFITTHAANRRGYYVQTSERDEQGYYGNPQPFLKRMGVPKCS